jgi:hypothetical protein
LTCYYKYRTGTKLGRNIDNAGIADMNNLEIYTSSLELLKSVMEVRGSERLSQHHFKNGYSEFEHTQPAGLGMRTAMNADEINI